VQGRNSRAVAASNRARFGLIYRSGRNTTGLC